MSTPVPGQVADLPDAIRDLSDGEVEKLIGWAYTTAGRFVDDELPRVAAFWHALGVTLAEDSDRRRAEVRALDASFHDDDGQAGEIVGS